MKKKLLKAINELVKAVEKKTSEKVESVNVCNPYDLNKYGGIKT